MTVPMITTKALRYAGRAMRAGEEFDARSAKDAKLLKAIRKADYRTVAIEDAPEQKPMRAAKTDPVAPAAPEGVDDGMSALRAEYEAKLGKRPFMGWDVDTLRARIAAFEADEA